MENVIQKGAGRCCHCGNPITQCNKVCCADSENCGFDAAWYAYQKCRMRKGQWIYIVRQQKRLARDDFRAWFYQKHHFGWSECGEMYDWIQKEMEGIPLPEHATVGGWKIWLLNDGSLRVWGGKNTEIDVDSDLCSGIILKESDRDNLKRYIAADAADRAK